MISLRSLNIVLITLAAAATVACGSENAGPARAPDSGNSAGGVAGTGSSGGSAGASGGPAGGAGGVTASGGASSGGGASGGASGGAASGAAGGAGGSSGGAGGSSGGAGGSSGGGSNAGGWTYPDGVTKPRIMIVGDSISAGPGCYKKYLLQNLNDNGYSNFEFVGEYDDDCGGGVKHSAVSCSTASQYTQATFTLPNCSQGTSFPGMSTLVDTHDPDLVMIQLGVNDVWGGQAVNTILGNYATLVEQARTHNPAVATVVAQIHKIRPDCSTDDSKTKLAESLVNAVPAWAQGLSTAQSPVFVADLWTNSDWSKTETSDCVHPNDVGAQKMGQNWYDALKGILKSD